MHTVLSFLALRPVEGLLDNHRQYAEQHRYHHVVIDSTHVFGERQVALHRGHAIYQQLQSMPDGDLLLLLDVFSLVYHPHALETVAHGYDSIVTTQAADSNLPTFSGMILRNTPDVRERIRLLVLDLGHWAMYLEPQNAKAEVELLGERFTPHPFVQPLHTGFYAAIQCLWRTGTTLDSIQAARPLVAHHAPSWEKINTTWIPSPGYDFRHVQALLLEAKHAQNPAYVPAMAAFKAAAQRPRELLQSWNLAGRIAFVTLYTQDIAGYGEIHERSLSRYCERHGYAYHAYRASPNYIPEGVTANWAKAHLVRHHLKDHDFVFWIDADTLAIEQSQGIDAVIEGRYFVIGTDHAAWSINSCCFGMRNTPDMHRLLDDICARIEAVPDRSHVYASGGDQQIIMETLERWNMLNPAHVYDALSLVTSPIYATDQHRFVHFPAQYNQYRALSMRVWAHESVPLQPD